jgi:phosphoribosylaminoimidazole (AIR) synthetase
MPKAYEEAGVSVEAGYEVVKRIKSHVARTNRPGVVGGINIPDYTTNMSETDVKNKLPSDTRSRC